MSLIKKVQRISQLPGDMRIRAVQLDLSRKRNRKETPETAALREMADELERIVEGR